MERLSPYSGNLPANLVSCHRNSPLSSQAFFHFLHGDAEGAPEALLGRLHGR